MMKVLRANGTEESLTSIPTRDEIRALLDATSLDTVSLNRIEGGPYTLYVDDLGQSKGLLPNRAATELYHTQCKPGTTWQILGDAVLVRDAG